MAEATPPRISTARLSLDPLTVADAEEMVGVLAHASLYRFTGGRPPTLRELRARYRRQVFGRSADGSEAWHNWIVRDRADGKAMGYVQATITGANGERADIAWVIGMPCQGHGYAAEAAGAMVEWLTARGVTTVTAQIHPGHEASAAVARRVGLSPTDESEGGEVVWRR
ncbi:MAG TPA: GNAT family N-acetyltransferase [Candidatus Limnocylindrales bacterium]|nr:GNAT family N-acetyltransferase [Candidatus Limnocylindrales bacterium]